MSDYWAGADRIGAVVKDIRARKNKGARRGLQLALVETLGRSNAQVPHEEGDLERDGGVSLDDDRLLGAVSYGRNADTKDYAERQHEDMTLKHDAGRNAKFLENALNSMKNEAGEIVAASIRREMSR